MDTFLLRLRVPCTRLHLTHSRRPAADSPASTRHPHSLRWGSGLLGTVVVVGSAASGNAAQVVRKHPLDGLTRNDARALELACNRAQPPSSRRHAGIVACNQRRCRSARSCSRPATFAAHGCRRRARAAAPGRSPTTARATEDNALQQRTTRCNRGQRVRCGQRRPRRTDADEGRAPLPRAGPRPMRPRRAAVGHTLAARFRRPRSDGCSAVERRGTRLTRTPPCGACNRGQRVATEDDAFVAAEGNALQLGARRTARTAVEEHQAEAVVVVDRAEHAAAAAQPLLRAAATVAWRRRSAQHAACNTQHAACYTQHAACNTQLATRNTQLATRSLQHATRSLQHATRNTQLATRSLQHATCNTQRATGSIRHYSLQSTGRPGDVQHATCNVRRATPKTVTYGRIKRAARWPVLEAFAPHAAGSATPR
jgi:hypothetical protein